MHIVRSQNYILDYSLITLHRMPISYLTLCIVFHILFRNFCCSAHVSCINMMNINVGHTAPKSIHRQTHRQFRRIHYACLESKCLVGKVSAVVHTIEIIVQRLETTTLTVTLIASHSNAHYRSIRLIQSLSLIPRAFLQLYAKYRFRAN